MYHCSLARCTHITNRKLIPRATFINLEGEVVGVNKLGANAFVAHTAIYNIVHVFPVITCSNLKRTWIEAEPNFRQQRYHVSTEYCQLHTVLRTIMGSMALTL